MADRSLDAPATLLRTTAASRPERYRLPALAKPRLLVPSLLVIVMLAFALAPGWFAPFEPTDMDTFAILAPPGGGHLLGTDHFGRDILSLVIHGARQSRSWGRSRCWWEASSAAPSASWPAMPGAAPTWC